MTRKLIINAIASQNVRVAILAGGLLENFFEESEERYRTQGNIYLGKVTSIQPGLEACFVDYGRDKQGFLPMDEILPGCWARQPRNPKAARIETVMKPAQLVLVQVDKEPVGTKGARLTTDVSLAGRYLVLMPFSDKRGVSRKIEDPEQRSKHKEIVAKLTPPKGVGFILRTAAMGQNKRDLARDMNYLVRLWKDIQSRSKQIKSPALLHAEADIVRRVLRDYYTNDMDQVWIDDVVAMDKARAFFKLFMPRQQRKLKAYTEKVPIFSSFGVEEQIESIHRRKVGLPSGGSLVVDQTEALVAIDVNSGKTRGRHGQEELAYDTNREAAEEIARQLRLRNLGGIIVIDFIDMFKSSHKSDVERALRDAMREDKARHQIGKISTFGLCTLTRQRLDQAIRFSGYRECPTCRGDGVIRSPDTASVRLLRTIQTEVAAGSVAKVLAGLHPEFADHLQNRHRADLIALEREFSVNVVIESDPKLDRSEQRIEYVPRKVDTGRKPDGPSPAVTPGKPPVVPQDKPPAVPQEPSPSGDARPQEQKRRRRRRRRKKPKE